MHPMIFSWPRSAPCKSGTLTKMSSSVFMTCLACGQNMALHLSPMTVFRVRFLYVSWNGQTFVAPLPTLRLRSNLTDLEVLLHNVIVQLALLHNLRLTLLSLTEQEDDFGVELSQALGRSPGCNSKYFRQGLVSLYAY